MKYRVKEVTTIGFNGQDIKKYYPEWCWFFIWFNSWGMSNRAFASLSEAQNFIKREINNKKPKICYYDF